MAIIPKKLKRAWRKTGQIRFNFRSSVGPKKGIKNNEKNI
jgi:hypothetical protein